MWTTVLGPSVAVLMLMFSVGSAVAEPAARVVESGPLLPVAAPAGASRALQATYRSAGPNGEPALSSEAIYLPPGAPPPGGWPVIAWAQGTVGVGVGDRCAPSRNPVSARAGDAMTYWLQHGYAVTASDYVGLGAPGVHPLPERAFRGAECDRRGSFERPVRWCPS